MSRMQTQAIRREEYRTLDCQIESVDLDFDLEPKAAHAKARLSGT